MNAVAVTERLPKATLNALLVLVLAVAAPHALRLPVWLSGIAVLIGVWRWQIGLRGLRLPPRALRLALTLASAGVVWLQFGTIAGRDAGTALLTLMTALKLLETSSRRDALVVLYLAYFLVITQFLYSQSPFWAAYLFGVTWAATVLLITVNRATGSGFAWAHGRTAASLLCQAAPIMVLLFVLFPRIPGPLWGLPEDAFSARTGLSDTLAPGTVSELSRSDAVAFRVELDGDPPPPQQRYWRGPVLNAYDGRRWRQGERRETRPPAKVFGEPLDYTVTVEPHGRRWLFALDLPSGAPSGARLSSAHELVADETVRSARRYRQRSYTNHRLEAQLPRSTRRRYSTLPAGIHPRTRELARDWAATNPTPQALMSRALRHFRREPFVYTLSPPRLTRDTVDQFLFDTRRGFCGHYASAFAVLMRAAGVPTRIVTGYLGGEMSPDDSYMIVRQSDAHAWTEVWLDGKGWTRVDPTAAVSPQRIELGLGRALPADEPIPAMARPGGGWIKDLRLAWDGLDAAWNRWILGYGPRLQQQFLSAIGLGDWQRMAAALGVGLALAMAAGVAFTLRGAPASPADPIQKSWERFCKRLARIGLPRRPHEGPRDYAQRVAAGRPDLAAEVGRIAALYSQLRYGRHASRRSRQRFREAVNRFRPRRRNTDTLKGLRAHAQSPTVGDSTR